MEFLNNSINSKDMRFLKPANMKRPVILFVACCLLAGLNARAQTASFNFSAATQTVSGWVNIAGDPSTGVRSATSNGYTVSSVATANWVPISGVGSAYDGLGAKGGTFFPSGVMLNHWFQSGDLGVY